MKPIKCSNS